MSLKLDFCCYDVFLKIRFGKTGTFKLFATIFFTLHSIMLLYRTYVAPAFLCRKLFFTVFKERKLNNLELDDGKIFILPG